MPVPAPEFKKALKRLGETEKEALLLRAVRRDAELYETFRFELLPLPKPGLCIRFWLEE